MSDTCLIRKKVVNLKPIIYMITPKSIYQIMSNADCFMRKLSFIIALLLLWAANATADPVTKETAQRTAESFLAKHGMKNAANLALTYQGRTQVSGRKGAPATAPCYYVFNNADEGGFVIVSGDDATEPILGYSDTGSFDAENIPVGMQELLNGYKQEIEYARANGLGNAKSVDVSELTEPARQVIEPLISTKWNQGTPYNLQCFTTDGQQAMTGCVATAFAQIMYYHKWPQSATTSIPAYSSYAALPATTFDWDNMLPTYTEHLSENDVQKNAAAALMAYCGHAVQMTYGTGSSGANTSLIINALKNYFGYANNATIIYREDFDANEWDERIYHELHRARPVVYSAKAEKSGHAFICDGYDGNGLFHINWGWGGLSDGYFRLQALNPNNQGTGGSNNYCGYSLNQSVIIGISPAVVNDSFESGEDETIASGIENSQLNLVDNNWGELSSGESTVSYDAYNGLNNLRITYSYRRIDEEHGYDVALGLFKGDELLDTRIIVENYEGTNTIIQTSGFSLNGFGTSLSDGTYIIKGIDRITGTDEWVPSIGSDVYNITIEINNGMVTAKKVVVVKPVMIEVTKVEQDLSSTNPMKLKVYVKNAGQERYNGTLYLRNDGNLVAYEGIYLPVGGEDYVTFAFGGTAGAHQIVIADNGSGNNPLFSGSLTLVGQTSVPMLTKVSEEVKNVSGNDLYGTLFEGSVTLKNATTQDYNNQLQITLYKSKGNLNPGYYAIYSELRNLSIPAGATVTVPLSAQVAIGDVIYMEVLEATNPNTSYYSKGAYTVKAAVVTWTADGLRTAKPDTSSIDVADDVVAIELDEIDLSTTTVMPNSNPNTLYIIGANAAVPTSLNEKNVVKGYKTQSLALEDGYNYLIPRTVMVEGTVQYCRTPTLASDGRKGWSTITLPFAVQQVAGANNQELTWGNDFWLREFSGVTDGEVSFADVDTWVANEPYIIAVPDALKDQRMVFSATSTKVLPNFTSAKITDDYKFIGTSLDKTITDQYVMNSEGSAFVPSASATVLAGYAYFTVGTSITQPQSIPISTGGIPGDVNGDGTVDVADITMLVNYILGKNPVGIVLANADMNGDSEYNVTDLTLICNVILGK